MAEDGEQTCFVCGCPTTDRGSVPDGSFVACPNCGDFEITGTARACLLTKIQENPNGARRLSHAIRKLQQPTQRPSLGNRDVQRLIDNTPLPKPQEQADNLVLWLGKTLKGLGDSTDYNPETMVATVGGWDEVNVTTLVGSLQSKGLVVLETRMGYQGLALTMEGWERYQQLEVGVSESRKAFMAMRYGDELLDRVYGECFKPSVKATGFDLLRLDECPEPGLIDNRMRTSIRTARFLVADLTHANLGAYWESGFAEGLGKPVIYTCEQGYFNKDKTHFDTNHSHTVVWSESELGRAARELAATVRNTFPTESILEGD